MILKLARLNLVVGAITLAAYGVVLFLQPSVLAGLVGLEFTRPDAQVEIRAFYGGLELGIAAFLLACARSPGLVPAGLLFLTLAFSFAGVARVIGLLQYGAAGPAQGLAAAIELLVAGLSAWLKTRLARLER